MFDQISIGSSLNPDEDQNDNYMMNAIDMIKYNHNNTNEEGESSDEEYFEEDDDDEEEENNNNQIEESEMKNTNYKVYDYKNSIDPIFTFQKIKKIKLIPENDPRRFEDAD